MAKGESTLASFSVWLLSPLKHWRAGDDSYTQGLRLRYSSRGFKDESCAPQLLECLGKVGQQVSLRLDAQRNPDERVSDLHAFALLGAHLPEDGARGG